MVGVVITYRLSRLLTWQAIGQVRPWLFHIELQEWVWLLSPYSMVMYHTVHGTMVLSNCLLQLCLVMIISPPPPPPPFLQTEPGPCHYYYKKGRRRTHSAPVTRPKSGSPTTLRHPFNSSARRFDKRAQLFFLGNRVSEISSLMVQVCFVAFQG